MTNDVVVIGGGPAGMMAAGRAGKRGANVLLIEKTYRLGSKLLLTGGGRCNITNNAEMPDMIAAFGKNGKFLYRALSVFPNNDLMEFFISRGLQMRTDPDGKIFPIDEKADSVLAVLRAYHKENDVEILYNNAPRKIIFSSEEKDRIKGVSFADGIALNADKIIIATGGVSYPKTGSTGDGYDFAKQCGHTIVPLRPGLSALESDGPFVKDLQGLTLNDIVISVIINGKKKREEKGNILFTHFGVSGPVVLNLSGDIIDSLINKSKVELSLNLMASFNLSEFTSYGSKTVSLYFKKTLPSSLSLYFDKLFSAISDKKCSVINRKEREMIAACFTDFRIPVIGYRPIEEAMITRGGVCLKEINPQTMESRLVKGLYFCGEVIDLAGITGGYNLQAAFSTGFLAGDSAANI